jgi:hypothetical protein
MTDTDKPRFTLRLVLSTIGPEVEVDDPSLVTDKLVNQAYSMVGTFLMDALDDLEPDITDERFRELFVELLYKLIYKEMTILHLLPFREEIAMQAIKEGKRYYGPPKRRKGDTN